VLPAEPAWAIKAVAPQIIPEEIAALAGWMIHFHIAYAGSSIDGSFSIAPIIERLTPSDAHSPAPSPSARRARRPARHRPP